MVDGKGVKKPMESEPGRIGITVEIKPHAYDPVRDWERFEQVLPRRLLAFAIDLAIILAPVALVAALIILIGFVTLGLGWGLLSLLYPGTVVWALIYYGVTLGHPASATLGMRAMQIEMRTWYGAPCSFVVGALHAIAFYVSISVLTPAGARGRLLQCPQTAAARRRARHGRDQQWAPGCGPAAFRAR
jgi:uncharacterized RDD family membrane protein YckC